jgi:hypothetical protein
MYYFTKKKTFLCCEKKKTPLEDPEMMATILDSFFAKKDKKIYTHKLPSL